MFFLWVFGHIFCSFFLTKIRLIRMAYGHKESETRATSKKAPDLRGLDKLSRILDSAFPIPGTRYRIGLDGLIGLIPGIGDTIGATLSTYIIFEAARLGVPKRILLRMLGNVAVESLVGALPIIGDIFDIAWKANLKNFALLRAHYPSSDQAERSPRQIIIMLLGVLFLIIVGLGVLTVLALRFLYQLITA
jgi:hypothetical protein